MPETRINRRVVVTGASGMVGSHLVARLLAEEGYEVWAPVRSSASADKLLRNLERLECPVPARKRLHVREGETIDPGFLEDLFREKDTVFHCAAEVSFDPRRGRELVRDNVLLAEAVAQAALREKVVRLVHVSSVAALGSRPWPEPVDENTPFESLAGLSFYSVSKYYAENEVWKAVRKGLPAVVVNPAVVLGAGNWEQGSPSLVGRAARGLLFYTDGVTGYVDARDVAEAMVRLSEHQDATGKRFLLCGYELSYRELLSALARGLGRKPPRFRASAPLLRLAAEAGRLAGLWTKKPVALTPEVARAALRKTHYDGSAVLRFCPGFRYTPWPATAERLCTLYRREHPSRKPSF